MSPNIKVKNKEQVIKSLDDCIDYLKNRNTKITEHIEKGKDTKEKKQLETEAT